MTDLKAIVTDIIDRHAAIHYEWGEDIYIANTEELADMILDAVLGTQHKPKPVDPAKMDEIGRKIGEVNSWAGDVDRQGGSFTDAEINSRLTGW